MQPHDKTLSPAPFTAPPDTLVWQLACPQCAAPEIERGDFGVCQTSGVTRVVGVTDGLRRVGRRR